MWDFFKFLALIAIVLIRAHVPHVLTQSRVAGLRLEGGYILRVLLLVVQAGVDGASDGAESSAVAQFIRRRNGRALHFLTQIDLVAVSTGCRGSSVRSEQHFLTAVLTLTGF